MSRIKRGTTSKRRHKKILKQAKGYYGARSRVYRVAKQAVIKAQQYAYRDRRCKKRFFKKLWITVINAFVRKYKLSYSKFMYILKCLNIKKNRKILNDIIKKDENLLKNLMEKVNNFK